jgi:hypothetical protein
LARIDTALGRTRRKQTRWFDEDSVFVKALRSAFPEPITIVPFAWSGRNSFAARYAASVNFRRHLWRQIRLFARREPETPPCCHVVVTHSHGGNVVVDALRQGDKGAILASMIGGVVTMSTPFLSYDISAAYPNYSQGADDRSSNPESETEPRGISELFRWAYLRRGASSLTMAIAIALIGTLVIRPLARCGAIDTLVRAGLWALGLAACLWAIIYTYGNVAPVDRRTMRRWPPRCPVVAMRGFADEASFALGAGQLLQRLVYVVSEWALRRRGYFDERWPTARQRFMRKGGRFLAGVALGAVGVWFVLGSCRGVPMSTWRSFAWLWLWAISAETLVTHWSAVLELFLLPPVAVVATAIFGRDAFPYVVRGRIDAESVPDGGPIPIHLIETRRTNIYWRNTTSIQHALPEDPFVASNVAQWIRIWSEAWPPSHWRWDAESHRWTDHVSDDTRMALAFRFPYRRAPF